MTTRYLGSHRYIYIFPSGGMVDNFPAILPIQIKIPLQSLLQAVIIRVG